eukprot:gb/GEZN01008734.1/.p1 GENE.gb/GEZN01008734.1/~~gb/GEZN01008734.1/.p1  ORF type:complete len:337 (-),score=93.05 gb/GEZN01008734.1/:385-1368(-)
MMKSVDGDGDGKFSKKELDAVWRTFDFNGNGKLSLAEIDKAVKQSYPQFAADARALQRAYRAADKDGSDYITRKEFGDLIRQLDRMQSFSRMFAKLDKNGDQRISKLEFEEGHTIAEVPAGKDDLEKEFMKLDVDGGGFILFAEFVEYMVNKKYDTAYKVDELLIPSIQKDFFGGFWTKKELDALWIETDKNGDGTLDQKEVSKLVKKIFPAADSKVANRAIKAADRNLDGIISRKEFVPLIQAIDEMIEISEIFKALDRDRSNTISFKEFKAGFELLKIPGQADEATFKKLDRDGGGSIAYIEFVAYMKKQRDQARLKAKKESKSK